MDRSQETAVKLDRLRSFIAEHDLPGVLLRSRANFAWLTGGGLSYIDASSEKGVGSLLVTAEHLFFVANNIEAQRFVDEELDGLGSPQVIEYPWYTDESEMEAIRKVMGNGVPAVDLGDGGEPYPEAIKGLRTPLVDAEIERYRELGKLATVLTEGVCHRIAPGMSEDDVVAMTRHAFAERGVRVPVLLVAADERIELRRHPISKGRRIERRVMLVVCAEAHGLWVNLTRLVNLEPIAAELAMKHEAVCRIDATVNDATRPGRTLGEIFAELVEAYEANGFADQWQYHHQGGSTGYAGRDAFATPTSDVVVQADQAFAWNPSITGTKCEDTMLVGADGLAWLTEPGEGWPVVEVEHAGRTYRRAGILARA